MTHQIQCIDQITNNASFTGQQASPIQPSLKIAVQSPHQKQSPTKVALEWPNIKHSIIILCTAKQIINHHFDCFRLTLRGHYQWHKLRHLIVAKFNWRASCYSRVVHASISCDPTQPISWLTQPNPLQVEKFWSNPTQPNTTNNGAYSLAVTYFYIIIIIINFT